MNIKQSKRKNNLLRGLRVMQYLMNIKLENNKSYLMLCLRVMQYLMNIKPKLILE